MFPKGFRRVRMGRKPGLAYVVDRSEEAKLIREQIATEVLRDLTRKFEGDDLGLKRATVAELLAELARRIDAKDR